MTRKEIIDGLKMTMGLIAFDPSTGEVIDPDNLNDLDRTTYDACKGAVELLETQDVARERYEDLCEYFNNNPHTIETILNDRKEFKAWLERMHWHVLECNKLARKLEALEGKDNVPDTNVGDIISRQTAIKALHDEIVRRRISEDSNDDGSLDEFDTEDILRKLPSTRPERVWTPCDIPPEHHRDVIVRGIEAIGNVTVHNIMQWDVDRWRPENYAPSIIWLEWSEI